MGGMAIDVAFVSQCAWACGSWGRWRGASPTTRGGGSARRSEGGMAATPPVKVTAEPIDMRVTAEEVSHDPAIDSVEVPRLRTAGPLEVRLPSKMDVELVSVSAPDQVMLEAKVVLIPGLTTTSCRVCVTLMEPPEMLATTVEVPAANAPA